MKLFEGKSPAERNKIIAVSVLGVMVLIVFIYNFGGSLFGSKKNVTVKVSSTPTPTGSPRPNSDSVAMPKREDEILAYTTTPVVYNPDRYYAPDAGRNIFAFYEPPPPTPYVPTPPPTPKLEPPITPVPTPTPEFFIGFVTPQSVYAGQKTFRLEVNGDKFTPGSLIFLNGSQLPTTFISPQKLVADVPSNFISGAGAIQILVRTSDGGLFSNQVALTVQAPPTPQLQYIGMIARQRGNNDTAYFTEPGKPTQTPIGARLNDVVGGRFRLTSISANETVFVDVNLGFIHRIALLRPPLGQTTSSNPSDPNNPNNPNRSQNKGNYNPNVSPNANPNFQNPQINIQQGDCPPGIPCNLPVYVPPQPPPKTENDEDDDGDNR